MSARDRARLARAVAQNYSIRGALRALGLAPAGGNYETIKKAIREFALDTSHFTGQGIFEGNRTPTARARSRRFFVVASWRTPLA